VRWRLLVVTLLTATAASGCISVPTAGPVEQVEPRGAESDFLVQVVPSGPEPGASPEEVVGGWLTAMKAFPVSTDVARAYLTDEAAQAWAPERRTSIYSTVSVVDSDSGAVQLRSRQVAELSARGAYRPVSANTAESTVSLRLTQTGAGWRIVDPPNAAMLSVQFFEEYYRPFDLYFFDPAGAVLIPDPVWLPLGDQLPTQLARGLLAGPTPWLRGQAVTALSAAAAGVSAPVRSDGVADVQLSEQAANLSGPQRVQLSAQLAWTLSQVTGLAGVRLRVNGAPLDVPDADALQTIESWQRFAPSGPATRAQLFGLRRGDLVAVDSEAVTPVSGWWGDNRLRLTDFSVERTLQRVAAVTGGRRLLVGDYVAADRSALHTWYVSPESTSKLRDPQWDRAGKLWVLDAGADRASLVVSGRGGSRSIPIGQLARAGIDSFEVSPDGARVAALVDRWRGPYRGGAEPANARSPVLVIARVVRAADQRTVRRLDKAYAVPVSQTGLREMTSPGWGAPSEVGVLGRVSDLAPQVYRLAIDGSSVEGAALTGEALLGPVGADELADTGVATAQTVIGTRNGRLYVLDSESEWSRLGAANEIVHPGHPD